MESRKTKSQSNLISRVTSVTEFLPHTQSLHSKQSLYNAAGAGYTQLPAIASRPGSSRPQSRVDILRPMSSRPMSSRPMSGRPMSGRPPSLTQLDQARMEARRSPPRNVARQQSASLRQRPGSAVRPLSSGVFMRRMEHGWVAKHYPQTELPSSRTDLNDDTGSDCDSLDSFFDEEFDDREESERLGDLLSCNTLGVESKGQKRDWTPGEVGIPKFHCPRCRDHWYGLTPFPCDEELARLIREGLWYTGQGDQVKSQPKVRSGEWRGNKGSEGHSGSPERGDAADSSRFKPKRILKGKSGEHDSVGSEKTEAKKTKRKITFKLASVKDEQELESKHEFGSSDLFREDAATTGMDSTGDGVKSGKENLNNLSSSAENKSLSTSIPANGSHQMIPPYDVMSSDHKSEDLKTDESKGSKSSPANPQRISVEVGKEKMQRSALNPLAEGESKCKHDENEGENKALQISGEKGRNEGASIDLTDGAGVGLGRTPDSSHQGAMSGRKDSHSATSDGVKKLSEVSRGTDGSDSLHQESLASVTSGRKMSESAGPDYGRKVRKAGGYMRASSPTGSEWDDPSHARPYASSTVTSSQTGSTSNLHKDKTRGTLPPIIPPIRAARKAVRDFPEGSFDITPPWRYSYFSPSPLYAAAADQRRTATTATRKKK